MGITERLTEVFRKVFHDESIVLDSSMTADDVDEWDSFSYINLLLAVELEFNIEFKQKEISNLENVGALIQIIERKISN